jgi:bifunctional non-homologous end joining protein LigD
MALKTSIFKRKLDQTPGPQGLTKKKKGTRLHFYIQKHSARRLHYDFRLELDGALLSWAVPKGPSLNTTDKRLAIKVEDHPLDYGTFEGIIPEGNEGAGTVKLWDKGTFVAYGCSSRKESEKKLREGLAKGHLEIELDGEKLHGKFTLVQLKNNPKENAWLLVKGNDAYATTEDVTELDYSVKKNRSKKLKLDKMPIQPLDKTPAPKRTLKSTPKPKWISPMLARLVQKPFNDKDWLFEIKWDGYRVLAYLNKSKVNIYSRNQNSFNSLYPNLVAELKKLSTDAIFDGEIVALDSSGHAVFDVLQNYQNQTDVLLCYYIFDLLYYQGRDLRELPLIERKEILKKLLSSVKSPLLRYSDHIEEKGIDFFKEASKENLEGIVGKKKTSTYQSRRSLDWVKIKIPLRQEVVIGGFTQPRGSRKKFGALLVGVYEKDQLKYVGRVGGGFNTKMLQDIYEKIEPLIQIKCPFDTTPIGHHKATWIKPKLICEVSFSAWTADQKMRMPIFRGLRIDKKPKTVIKEEAAPPPTKSQNPDEIRLTNLGKIYWREEKYTKGDMVEYYRTLAPHIIPYLKNHPIMLHRYPNGTGGQGFYQKNLKSPPPGIQTTAVKHVHRIDYYLTIPNLSSLLYAANLGSIDLHPMIAQIGALNYPDYVAIDLDPEDISFKKVVECANGVHELLEELKIPNYCKTSGGRGLHIYIPVKGKFSFAQTTPFAELLARLIQQKMPDLISLERHPSKRQKRIYIDFLQNSLDHTMVAPYSLRPRPHAPVSTPLRWSEVNERLDPLNFNLKSVPARVAKLGDLFKPTLTKSLDLERSLKRIEKLIA